MTGIDYDLNEAMNTEHVWTIIEAERRRAAHWRLRFMLALVIAFCWMPFWRSRERH